MYVKILITQFIYIYIYRAEFIENMFEKEKKKRKIKIESQQREVKVPLASFRANGSDQPRSSLHSPAPYFL